MGVERCVKTVTMPERCGIVHDVLHSRITWSTIGTVTRGITTMDENQAKRLGSLLRRKREDLGLSSRALGKLTSVDAVTIQRFELGTIAAPAPDKLARIAEALGLNLADVYAHAGYVVPTDLPSFTPYLRTKYAVLPDEDVEAIERYAQKLAKKHGVSLSGPAPGEDES